MNQIIKIEEEKLSENNKLYIKNIAPRVQERELY